MTGRVIPVPLGRVTLPDSHPRFSEGTCPIIVHAIEHPDGVVLVDTGPGMGHPVIDELYAPEVDPIVEALNRVGIDERDVAAVVITHLHFDHCGQHHLLPAAPVWLTTAEVEAAAAPLYTVSEWAAVEPARLRLSTDEEEVATGVRIVHTPGHTPGHQSVAVDGVDGLELVVGQACYSCAEFASGRFEPFDMHDDQWVPSGRAALDRLRHLGAVRAHFSHDPMVYGG